MKYFKKIIFAIILVTLLATTLTIALGNNVISANATERNTTEEITPVNLSVPYNTTTFRNSGRSNLDSIVLVIMGEGYTASQQDIFLSDVSKAVNYMMWHYPFNLFAQYFTIIALHTISAESGVSDDPLSGGIGNRDVNNRFGTYFSAYLPNPRITMPQESRREVRQLAEAVAGGGPVNGRNRLDMVHVIANTPSPGGSAWHERNELTDPAPQVGIALTATGPMWETVFMHEKGHSFGALRDEHRNATGEAPNMTAETNNSRIRWSHWIGHGGTQSFFNPLGSPNIGVYREGHAPLGWAIPVPRLYCLMSSAIGVALREFCAVCRAEITRRLAYIAREPFYSKLPNGTFPHHQVAIDSNATRILPYAFHGNSRLQSLTLPATINSIGRYAFLGARSLRVITMQGAVPPSIDSTTFIGLDTANITVLVPANTRNAYINSNWGTLGFNIQESPLRFTVINTSQRTARAMLNPTPHAHLATQITVPSSVMIDGHLHTVTDFVQTPDGVVRNVTHISLPATITNIPDSSFNNAFNNMPQLQYLSVDPSNPVFKSGSGIIYRRGNPAEGTDTSAFHVPIAISGDITIPHGVGSLGITDDTTFRNRTAVTSIHIPATLQSAGQNAFVGTSGLQSITVDPSSPYMSVRNGVLYVGNFFSHKPAGLVRTIGLNTPTEFHTLPNIYAHYRDVNQFRFVAPSRGYFQITPVGGAGLFSNLTQDGVTVFLSAGQVHNFNVAYTGTDLLSRRTIPLRIIKYSRSYVLHFAERNDWIMEVTGFTALSNFDGHITIPWNTSIIAENAFRNATNLQSVTLASASGPSLDIGNHAFANTSLQEFTIFRSVFFRQNVFTGSNNITFNVDYRNRPNNWSWDWNSGRPVRWGFRYSWQTGLTTYIANDSYGVVLRVTGGAGTETSVTLPSTVGGGGTPIVTAPNNPQSQNQAVPVTTIRPNAFNNAGSITEITIPSSITNVNDITFPTSLTVNWEGRFAFRGNTFVRCLSSESFSTIPNTIAGRTITAIDPAAFNGRNITAINVAANNQHFASIGGVLFNRNQTTLIRYPEARTAALSIFVISSLVTHIESGAFSGVRYIEQLNINSVGRVVTLGDGVFANNSSIQTIRLQNAVTRALYASNSAWLATFSVNQFTSPPPPAIPSIIPNDLTATLGQALYEINLPIGWTWANPYEEICIYHWAFCHCCRTFSSRARYTRAGYGPSYHMLVISVEGFSADDGRFLHLCFKVDNFVLGYLFYYTNFF